jgi:hypothetical protein
MVSSDTLAGSRKQWDIYAMLMTILNVLPYGSTLTKSDRHKIRKPISIRDFQLHKNIKSNIYTIPSLSHIQPFFQLR